MQANATEVKNVMEDLIRLRREVICNKSKVSRVIGEARSKLQAILNEEENRYVETHAPKEDVVAVEDAKLNALFEAIAFLGNNLFYPKQIVKNIDDAVMKLQIFTK